MCVQMLHQLQILAEHPQIKEQNAALMQSMQQDELLVAYLERAETCFQVVPSIGQFSISGQRNVALSKSQVCKSAIQWQQQQCD